MLFASRGPLSNFCRNSEFPISKANCVLLSFISFFICTFMLIAVSETQADPRTPPHPRFCLSAGDHLSCQQGPPPLPPAPPPHKTHPSITSLSRSSLANQRSPSPPPTAGLAADLQSTAECVQLQDSWVLGSNVALESR